MSKTWVSSSATARSRPRRGRGANAAGTSRRQTEQERGEASGGFSAEGSLRNEGQRYDYYGARRAGNDLESGELERDRSPAQISSISGRERHLQRQGGYYVQQPEPSQNQKLKNMAEAEVAAYDQYRTEKRAQVTQSLRQFRPQALGGSSFDVEETRAKRARDQEREQQLNARYAGIIQKRKREEHMKAKQTREEKEFEEKKKKQREKAEHLEVRKEIEEQRKRDEMRRARLTRFDQQK